MLDLKAGSHTAIYALSSANHVCLEIGMSAAAHVAPFDADRAPSLTGDVLMACKDRQDCGQMSRQAEVFSRGRHRFASAFDLCTLRDLADVLKNDHPALVILDLSQYLPYATGSYGEATTWLQHARALAIKHDCAVLSAVTVTPRYVAYPSVPGQQARHRKEAQSWNLGDYADTLLAFDDETFLLDDGTDAIRLTRREASQDRRFFHLVLAKYIPDPVAEIYTRQPTDDPRIHAMPPIRLKD